MATDDLIGMNSDGRLEDFAALVHTGLETADWLSQRELIRALVKRVEVAQDLVHVVFRVDQAPVAPRLEKKSLQDCRESTQPIAVQHLPAPVRCIYGISRSKRNANQE